MRTCWKHALRCMSFIKFCRTFNLGSPCWLFLLSLCCTPGSKAAAVEYPNNMYHVGSPVGTATLQIVQLAEDLKLALELQPNQEERENLRAQLPSETTQALINWLQNGEVSIQTCLFSPHCTLMHLHSAVFINLSSNLLICPHPCISYCCNLRVWISEAETT